MSAPSASRAVTASGFALLVFGGCLLMFMPPFVTATTESPAKTVLIGIAIACSLVLHLAFLGIAAQRLNRRPWVWVLLGLLLLPVGSIVALVLFSFFNEERAAVNAAQA